MNDLSSWQISHNKSHEFDQPYAGIGTKRTNTPRTSIKSGCTNENTADIHKKLVVRTSVIKYTYFAFLVHCGVVENAKAKARAGEADRYCGHPQKNRAQNNQYGCAQLAFFSCEIRVVGVRKFFVREEDISADMRYRFSRTGLATSSFNMQRLAKEANDDT